MLKIKCQVLFLARLLIVKVDKLFTLASVLNKNLSKSS